MLFPLYVHYIYLFYKLQWFLLIFASYWKWAASAESTS